MDYKQKIFISESPGEMQIDLIKTIFEAIDIEEYLSESFIYIELGDDGEIEIVSIEDEFVFSTSKELNISNKMSIQYLKSKHEIDQAFNEFLYWSDVNKIKKYIPVLVDDEYNKTYADINIYSKNVSEAIKELDEIEFNEYLYLEDVDEEI